MTAQGPDVWISCGGQVHKREGSSLQALRRSDWEVQGNIGHGQCVEHGRKEVKHS